MDKCHGKFQLQIKDIAIIIWPALKRYEGSTTLFKSQIDDIVNELSHLKIQVFRFADILYA